MIFTPPLPKFDVFTTFVVPFSFGCSIDETGWKIPFFVVMVVCLSKCQLFSYCFGPLGAKNFRLRRHLYTFSRLYVDCGTSSIVLETTTSKCGLSATDENGSEYFRQMMDDL